MRAAGNISLRRQPSKYRLLKKRARRRVFYCRKSEQAVDVAVFIDIDIFGGKPLLLNERFAEQKRKRMTACRTYVRLLDGAAYIKKDY